MSHAGTALDGVPATLPAGPLSISFGNDSRPDLAGYVLLAQVQDGVDVTAAQIAAGAGDFDPVINSVAVAQAADPTSTGYTLTTLVPGHYLVGSPLGTPPGSAATLAAEFTVG